MGYFSNGTEGNDYQEAYCVKCRNYNEGACPVWLAHEDFQAAGEGAAGVLDALIPRAVNGVSNLQCLMFLPMLHHTLPNAETDREIPSAARYEVFREGEKVHLLARRECDDPALKPGIVYPVVKANSDFMPSDNSGPKGAYTVTIRDDKGFHHCLPSTLLARVCARHFPSSPPPEVPERETHEN